MIVGRVRRKLSRLLDPQLEQEAKRYKSGMRTVADQNRALVQEAKDQKEILRELSHKHRILARNYAAALEKLTSINAPKVRTSAEIEADFAALSPRITTGEDAEFVLAQYEDVWAKRREKARQLIAAGETLAHIMTRLRPPMHQVKGYKRVEAAVAKKVMPTTAQVTPSGATLSRLLVSDSRYISGNNFDPILATFRLAAKAKNIVELGAGPGWNLFDLSIYLGKSVTKKSLFGLEYTAAGVDFMNMVNEREAIPLFAHRFDYYSPDLSMIPDDGPTLFFSHHSIEQVPTIHGALYEQILARRSASRIVHIEPIGWQRFPDLMDARESGDVNQMKALVATRLADLESNMAPAVNSAINSWRAGYNKNALGLMLEAAKHPRVELVQCLYDFNHRYNQNSVNPSTYVELAIEAAP